jgi:hypothetical protein
MEFHRGSRSLCRNLGAPFQASAAAPAERLIFDHHMAGIGWITLPNAVHTGIHACSAIKAVFLVDEDTIPRKGLPLFTNLLVETRSDHIEKPIKLGTLFHFLNKLRYFLNREVDGAGQVFLQVFIERAMLEVDLAFLIAAAAVKAEVKGQDL